MSGRERGEQVASTDERASAELTPEEQAFLTYVAELATASLQAQGAGSVAPEARRNKQ